MKKVSRQLRGHTQALRHHRHSPPQHTRRAKVLWRKFAETGQTAFVRAAWEDNFDADHWWRNTRDLFSVMREVMGLANAWAGLPVRPPIDLTLSLA